jgi:ribonuclease D
MLTQTVLFEGDIPVDIYSELRMARTVACDIETSGLDWRCSKIALVQLYTPATGAVVLRVRNVRPKRLIALLEDRTVVKVFHHAPFDLRFLWAHWSVRADSVVCTKVASRLLDPESDRSRHSLKPLLERYLGVVIDKSQQASDWLAPSLTRDQLEYAVKDVRYLLELWRVLEVGLGKADLIPIYRKCMEFLPTQVQLEVRGIWDIFSH